MLPSSDSVGFGPALIDPNPKYPILEALCPIVSSTAFLVLESVEDSFPAAADLTLVPAVLLESVYLIVALLVAAPDLP